MKLFAKRHEPITERDSVNAIALAIHEAELHEKCRARGQEREKHLQAYRHRARQLLSTYRTFRDGWETARELTLR